MHGIRRRVSCNRKGIALIAAGGLRFIRAEGASQSSVPWLAGIVIPDKQGVFIIDRLKKKLVLDTVVNDNGVNPTPLKILLNLVTVGIHFGEKQIPFLRSAMLLGRYIGLNRRSGQKSYRVRERHFFDLHEIVQRRSAADTKSAEAVKVEILAG